MPHVGIREQGEVDDITVGIYGHAVDHHLELLGAVRGQRQDLRSLALFGRQEVLQLAELLGAVGSPMAAVEEQHHVLLPAKLR